MDSSRCGTCDLYWPREERHPPCLKLSPEERRERGALMAQPEPDPVSK